MAKPTSRAHSRYAKEACELLGALIHEARVEHRMTVAELAERAGVSRGLVNRAESGDIGCSIGAVFEMAAILKVGLFDLSPDGLSRYLSMKQDKLNLLPKSVRKSKASVQDDF